MKRSCMVSSYEKDLSDSLKLIFPDIFTLKIRGGIISDKPWVGGFDIDIFDSKTNRGIEFDGNISSFYRRSYSLSP